MYIELSLMADRSVQLGSSDCPGFLCHQGHVAIEMPGIAGNATLGWSQQHFRKCHLMGNDARRLRWRDSVRRMCPDEVVIKHHEVDGVNEVFKFLGIAER